MYGRFLRPPFSFLRLRLCLTSCECVTSLWMYLSLCLTFISLFTQTKQSSGEKLMDGSEILSLLESARKPTEFIGGVSSSSQRWVQVAFCFHHWCSWPCLFALLYFFVPFCCVCLCVCGIHVDFASNTSEVRSVLFLCACLAYLSNAFSSTIRTYFRYLNGNGVEEFE